MQSEDPSTGRSRNPFEGFITGLQDFMYFAVGVAAAGYGGVALTRWLVATWQVGSELPVFLALVAVLLVPAALVLVVRRGRRIVTVGAMFFLLGVLVIGLSSFGLSSPASW